MTTLVLDHQGHQFGGMPHDSMYSNHMQSSPQFPDLWQQHGQASSPYPAPSKPEAHRPTTMSMPYSQIPVSASLTTGSSYSPSGYGGLDLLSAVPETTRSSYGHSYSAVTSAPSYPPTSYPATSLTYAQSLAHQQQRQRQQQRQPPEPEDGSRAAQVSFGELDASRGMLALSHQNVQDLTPRNIFEARVQRASSDAYGFPATSHHSSISSASGREYPYYAASSVGSVDSSTDYSSAASDTGYDTATAARTLPRPGQLVGASLGPPAPQSMMGQFSSKVPSNTQKKHKCKVCDKRFTRPSSLQTHMYSHTGEKPFKCEVDGCGRHFSVVSNLRRHGKVHRGEASSEHSGDED